MDVATMIADVRSRIDEDVEGYWTDVMLTRWLNEGARDVAYRLENLEDTETTATANSTEYYALPTDLLKIKRVQWDSIPLSWVNFPTLDKAESTGTPSTGVDGTPRNFYTWGDSIYLYPAPNAIKNLIVTYYKRPATLVNTTDTSEHPQELHPLIVIYAVGKALTRDEMYSEANWYDTLYREGIKEARTHYNPRYRCGVSQIRLDDS